MYASLLGVRVIRDGNYKRRAEAPSDSVGSPRLLVRYHCYGHFLGETGRDIDRGETLEVWKLPKRDYARHFRDQV